MVSTDFVLAFGHFTIYLCYHSYIWYYIIVYKIFRPPVRETFIKRGAKTDSLFLSFNRGGKVARIVRERIGQVLEEVAINADVNPNIISPHKIRHLLAAQVLQNGANPRIVQEWPEKLFTGPLPKQYINQQLALPLPHWITVGQWQGLRIQG